MIRLGSFSFLLCVMSCGKLDLPSTHRSKDNRVSADQTALSGFDGTREVLSDPKTIAWTQQSFDRSAFTQVDDEAIWSLGQCNCAKNLTGLLFKQWAQSKGVLPQILTPNIKEEVKNDPTLKTLAELPDLIKSLVLFFVNDETIAEKIREKIAAKISDALPEGSKLGELIKFRFDHFLYPNTKSYQDEPTYFSISTQLPRWYLNFATDGLWLNKTPIAFNDHGLQMLSSIQTLSEWQYLLGLFDKNNQIAGGLTYEINAGITSKLGEFNPVKKPDENRFISGGFILSYENEEDAKMATDLIETWTPAPKAVALKEQARLWQFAAVALSRLRPNSRGALQLLYDPEKGMLPDNVHGMPLVILSSMKGLLDGPFIDIEKQLIRANADITGNSEATKKQIDEPASFGDLIALANAVLALSREFRQVDDLKVGNLDPSILSEANDTLEEVIKLITQTLLRDYFFFTNAKDKKGISKLISLPFNEVTNAITMMLSINKDFFVSQFLHKKIINLVEIYFNKLFRERMHGKKPNLSLSELFNVSAMLTAIKNSDMPQKNLNEFEKFSDAFANQLKRWDSQ